MSEVMTDERWCELMGHYRTAPNAFDLIECLNEIRRLWNEVTELEKKLTAYRHSYMEELVSSDQLEQQLKTTTGQLKLARFDLTISERHIAELGQRSLGHLRRIAELGKHNGELQQQLSTFTCRNVQLGEELANARIEVARLQDALAVNRKDYSESFEKCRKQETEIAEWKKHYWDLAGAAASDDKADSQTWKRKCARCLGSGKVILRHDDNEPTICDACGGKGF